jgi:ERCC4-related helicase
MGIKNFKPRLYQQTIFGTASQFHTLVALPTGLGKTAISVMLASQRLKQYPESKIVILAPTRPLIDQHKTSFENYLELESEKLQVLSGSVTPEERAKLWEQGVIFFCTPQTLQNDVISGRISLKNVSMLCFDEAHRAIGDYSYVFVAKQYLKQAEFPRILALTASPGSDMSKIKEIVANLFIEKIEVRTDKDQDVAPYIQEVDTEWIEVELPDEFKLIHKYLSMCYKTKLDEIRQLGYLTDNPKFFTKKDLLIFQGQMHASIAKGERDFSMLRAVSLAAEAIKVEHALELIETQGLSPLMDYFESVFESSKTSKVKATQNLVKDVNFRTAYLKSKMFTDNIEHPKIAKLRSIVQNQVDNNPDVKILVFSHYRDMARKLSQELSTLQNVKCSTFVGQAKKKGEGMSQKEQLRILDCFRAGEYNVLISTSVGEEGLDIPQVDIVIFYEPVPSEIRKIQRQGRTGRLEKGRVIILVAKDTRDVGYKWAAYHKEKRMHKNLASLKQDVIPDRPITLDKFIPEQTLKVYADTREKGSKIIELLSEDGFFIELKRLDVGDYILSKDVGVEFKTRQDFVDSLIDGRLLEQIKSLKKTYQKPLIVVEGTEDIYGMRNIHPNAIRGLMATIALSYGIPILFTTDSKDTAELLSIIAKREQETGDKEFSPHSTKPKTDKEIQEYVVSSLPNVGGALAKDLLRRFKTIKTIINATEDELQEVANLGKKKASDIKRISEKEYEGI